MNKISGFAQRLLEEPPFRLFTKAVINRLPVSVRSRERWDVAPRPNYLTGVLAAADQALDEGQQEISVFEFGVAAGNGLIALENVSSDVSAETGIKIAVYGFDAGTGMPELIGDYRDYPDHWQAGDYPMNEELLRTRLKPATTLIVGNVAETIPANIDQIKEPIGFVAVDVDIYSSARDTLFKLFARPGRKMLRRTMMYFDDVDLRITHKFAGELLAIDEFNASNPFVRIDRWRGIDKQRPFPEAAWLRRMYIAHDIEAISKARSGTHKTYAGIDDDAGWPG
jgi:hypothetical protein